MTAKASLTVNRLKRWLPGLQIVREYQAAWFARDLMAGLVLTTMLVPVGIAYALASGVPGIYGLSVAINLDSERRIQALQLLLHFEY